MGVALASAGRQLEHHCPSPPGRTPGLWGRYALASTRTWGQRFLNSKVPAEWPSPGPSALMQAPSGPWRKLGALQAAARSSSHTQVGAPHQEPLHGQVRKGKGQRDVIREGHRYCCVGGNAVLLSLCAQRTMRPDGAMAGRLGEQQGTD